MRTVVSGGQRGQLAALAALSIGLLVFSVAVVGGLPLTLVAFVLVATVVVAIAHRAAFQWRTLVVALFAIILFVPIERYSLPGGLPLRLEPYRLALAIVLIAWLSSLLVDSRVRLKASGLEAPAIAILLSALASTIANGDRIVSLHLPDDVVRDFSFLLGYFLLFFLIVSLVRSPAELDSLIKVLAGGGTVIAVLAIIEARFLFNPFDRLADVIPVLRANFSVGITERDGSIRAFGPAQHPIALGAALVILVPLAVYLAGKTKQRRWWLAAILLIAGGFAAGSRTAVVMLGVIALVYLALRPRKTLRFWPVLLPAIVVIHFALPGALGSAYGSFFPQGGLVADQRASEGSQSSAGRVADLGPALREYRERPVFGQGFGTRITSGPEANAALLDDQWLKTLLEMGLCGVVAWAWLILRFLRRAGGGARSDLGSRGLLLTGLVGSIAAFGVGMFVYDAFSFVQVTLLFFILLAFGCVALSLPESEPNDGELRAAS